ILRQRANLRNGNLVVEKWSLGVVRARSHRPRVVQSDLSAVTIDESAEITLPHRLRPHARRGRRGLPQPKFFPSAEKESSIPDQRSAQRRSEFVADQMRCFGERVLPRTCHPKSAVAACFERRTMKLIRSAACAEDRTGRPLDPGAGYA